ncbi:MAG: DUF87 domain-containing protein [Niveispirillum sp.]|nr:DUF87 domain-containing protein [Niveispirillum sp.]
MSINTLTGQVLAKSVLAKLVSDPANQHIGFVFGMGYDQAKVLTNDAWRSRVGGVPLNAFLVACAFDPENFDRADELDKVVVLLRVTGPTPLPHDSDMVKAIIEHHQSRTQVARTDTLDGFDPFTHNQVQYGGLVCRVVGSFYVDGNQLMFGADVEDFFSASHLRVYVPTPDALKTIVNYADPIRLAKATEDAKKVGFAKLPDPFEVGHVQYTSTTRLQKAHGTSAVTVGVQPMDFLGRRTAVLGMTRTGKSNTVKTMVSAVSLSAGAAGVRVGQLIFDMNGEYANANQQDAGSSINDVFTDNTVRYRGLSAPGFFDLRNNFYESLDAGLEVLQEVVRGEFKGGQPDQQIFLGMSLQEPDAADRSQHLRWQKQVVLYRLLLWKAGFTQGTFPDQLKLQIGKSALEGIYDGLKMQGASSQAKKAEAVKAQFGDPSAGLTFAKMDALMLAARSAHIELLTASNQVGIPSSSGESWFDPTALSLANLLAKENSKGSYINGFNTLSLGRVYHSPSGSKSVPDDIYEHLRLGRIVIMDLSVGSEKVRRTMAEKIAAHILRKSSGAFNEGANPPSIVVYVEEAHNLIGKDAELDETWPRIAKEGAKFGISLVYSTQEPSSIHPNIMANTENLFVTHLNNDKEVKVLSSYYDFEDFAASIKKAQDVGFARVKTLSASFVVPTKIAKFDPASIKAKYDSLPKPLGFTPAPTP